MLEEQSNKETQPVEKLEEKQSLSQRRKWCETAAPQGNAEAQFQLGQMYRERGNMTEEQSSTGKDFSYQDLTGANFTEADCTGADFCWTIFDDPEEEQFEETI